MTKLKDLAQQLNLSVSTVSRALAGHTEISEASAKRVRALAHKLGYQPNQAAASLRRGQSQTIGVIVPYLRDNFFARVVQGIEATATARGYHILVCQSGDDGQRERQALTQLRQAGVVGVLLSVASAVGPPSPKREPAGVVSPVPLVFFDRHPAEGPAASAVVIDDQLGGYQATQHLLTQGYRRIAHLTGPQHLPIYQQRRLGYEQALREAGLPVLPALVLAGGLREADGVAATRQLLALPDPPDALFAAGDFAALGCLRELQAQQRRVPEEIGLIGFSNEFFTEVTVPSLSTIDQHCEQLGQAAVELLLDMSRERRPLPARHVVLRPQLLARASSTRLAAPGLEARR